MSSTERLEVNFLNTLIQQHKTKTLSNCQLTKFVTHRFTRWYTEPDSHTVVKSQPGISAAHLQGHSWDIRVKLEIWYVFWREWFYILQSMYCRHYENELADILDRLHCWLFKSVQISIPWGASPGPTQTELLFWNIQLCLCLQKYTSDYLDHDETIFWQTKDSCAWQQTRQIITSGWRQYI